MFATLVPFQRSRVCLHVVPLVYFRFAPWLSNKNPFLGRIQRILLNKPSGKGHTLCTLHGSFLMSMLRYATERLFAVRVPLAMCPTARLMLIPICVVRARRSLTHPCQNLASQLNIKIPFLCHFHTFLFSGGDVPMASRVANAAKWITIPHDPTGGYLIVDLQQCGLETGTAAETLAQQLLVGLVG